MFLVVFSFFSVTFLSSFKKETNKQKHYSSWTFLFPRKGEWSEETPWKHSLKWRVHIDDHKSKSLRLLPKNHIRLKIIPVFPWSWKVSGGELHILESVNADYVGIIQRLYLRIICYISLLLEGARIKSYHLEENEREEKYDVRVQIKIFSKKYSTLNSSRLISYFYFLKKQKK